MAHFRKISFAVAALLLCTAMYPQKKWTLQECITYAHENNLQVQKQQISVEQAENNLLSAKMEYIPSLNASMNHSMSWGRSVNLNDLEIIENRMSQSTSLNLSTSVPLFEGLQKQNTVKSNRKQLEIARTNIEKLKDDISINVAQAYLQVLLSREMEKVAVSTHAGTQQQVERCKTLVDAGSQPYSSLLELEAQLANDKLQCTNASNNVRSNMLALAQLLNIKDIEEFDIQIPDISAIDIPFTEDNVEDIYNSALSLPSIRSAELALEQSKLQYKIQKGAALPSLSFSAGYGTYYSNNQDAAFFSQFNNNRNPSMGFGLSIPIFNNWRSNTSIRNARLNVKSSEKELQLQQQNLLKEIQTAYNEALSCYEKCNASEQNMVSARESFKYTQEKFNAGMLGSTDYAVAKANLYKAESEYLQSKFQYIFQLKVLDYYKKTPITL